MHKVLKKQCERDLHFILLTIKLLKRKIAKAKVYVNLKENN